jgi:hypothetical protein
MGGACSTNERRRRRRRRGTRIVLVGKPEGRRPLGRPRRRWVDNIRMDLGEVGCGHYHWLARVRVVPRNVGSRHLPHEFL